MADFTWGDTVLVRPIAAASARPGSLAEIVGMREVENPMQAEQFQTTVGSTVYLLEFADGQSIEVPEAWLEQAPGDRGDPLSG